MLKHAGASARLVLPIRIIPGNKANSKGYKDEKRENEFIFHCVEYLNVCHVSRLHAAAVG
jgi:hypothetical protein